MSTLQEKEVMLNNNDNIADETMQVWKLNVARQFFALRHIGDTEAAIKKYKGAEKTVVIPYMVGSRKIVEVDDEAFMDNQDVEKVVFSAGVRRILTDAFNGCKNLKEVVFNSGLESIESRSFQGCSNLNNIILPETLINIDSYAFSETSIAKVTLPTSIKKVGSGAFIGCQNLKEVVFSSGDVFIASDIFCGRPFWESNVEKITMPDDLRIMTDIDNGLKLFGTAYYADESNWHNGVLYIGNHLIDSKSESTDLVVREGTVSIDTAIRGKNLEKVVLPEGLKHIGKYAFGYCDTIKEVNIPDSVSSIGFNAFHRDLYENDESKWENGILYIGKNLYKAKDNVSEVVVKEGTLSICQYAFDRNNNLKKITLPVGLQYIDEEAFSSCGNLSKVILPDGLVRIQKSAFDYCGMEVLILPSTVVQIDHFAFQGCENLKELTIPGSVKALGQNLFDGCTSLETVKIEEGVRELSYGMFYNCSNLRDIYIPSSVEKIDDKALNRGGWSGIYPFLEVTIHAPAGSYAEQYAKENEIKFVVE